MRRDLLALLLAFVVLDLGALALLGPVSPADTTADLNRLYGDRAVAVLISRFLHGVGLITALWLLALLLDRVGERGGTEIVSRVAYGGLVALVPIEIVRNVMFAALALRFEDFGAGALPMHIVAVLLGPAIAFPIVAALGALAWHYRSPALAVLAASWVASGARITTTSEVIWYAGMGAFAGLLIALTALTISLARPMRAPEPVTAQ